MLPWPPALMSLLVAFHCLSEHHAAAARLHAECSLCISRAVHVSCFLFPTPRPDGGRAWFGSVARISGGDSAQAGQSCARLFCPGTLTMPQSMQFPWPLVAQCESFRVSHSLCPVVKFVSSGKPEKPKSSCRSYASNSSCARQLCPATFRMQRKPVLV